MNMRSFEALACGSLLFLEEENEEVRDFLEDQVADDSRLTAPGFGRELGQQTTLELIQQRRENGSRHGWTAMKRKKRMRIFHLESPSAIP